MKNVTKYLLLLVAGVAMTACVNDLNTKPLDTKSATSFNQGAVFTKCYQTLALTGQQGPAGDGDIDDLDEGTSAFYRLMWELNEFPTDEGWWIWNDVGLADIRVMNWNGENDLVKGLYYRFNIDVKLCNHFLKWADDKLPETAAQKAEVRFIRALNYYYLLDLFYVAPFSIEESSDYPTFYTRPQLYSWLVGELEDLITLLPDNRLSLYRVDKTAAYLLLSRLYLNAEVYNTSADGQTKGEAQWAKALDAANSALASNYDLLQVSDTVYRKDEKGAVIDTVIYTAYQKLFMADNNLNGAQNESPLLIYQDGNYCQSYGVVQFVIASTRDAGMVPWGVSTQWKCFRSSPEFVAKFVALNKAAEIRADEYEMPKILGDDRAILCSGTDSSESKWKLNGGMSADFYDSWACPKFSAVYTTAVHPKLSVGSNSEWADTDVPLFRIAEAYMTKAEVLFRQGKNQEAADMINYLRRRANAAEVQVGDITEDLIIDEWSREFWGEGRRRSDLVRFNRFAGPQADVAKYQWEGRAGAGTYKSNDNKWNWYPVPSADKLANPNFKDVQSVTGMDGGDGYGYGSAK